MANVTKINVDEVDYILGSNSDAIIMSGENNTLTQKMQDIINNTIPNSILSFAVNGYKQEYNDTVINNTEFAISHYINIQANTKFTITFNSDINLFESNKISISFYKTTTRVYTQTINLSTETFVYQINDDVDRIVLSRLSTGVIADGVLNVKIRFNERIDDNEKNISNLVTQLTGIDGSISEIRNDIEEIQNDIESKNGRLDSLDETTTTIINRIGGITKYIDIPLTNRLTGKYYKISSNTFTLTSASGSYYEPIDLTNYIGKKVKVILSSIGSSSSRECGMGSSAGTVKQHKQEKNFSSEGVLFDIISGFEYLYLSFIATSDVVSVKIVDEIPDKLKNSPMYVSTSGDDINGDGSVNNPFATVNNALNAGANKVIIAGGIYKQTINIGLCKHSSLTICSKNQSRVIFKPSSNYIISEVSGELVNGTTKVYNIQTSMSISDWIYQENVNDESTLIAETERHPLYRGKEYRCENTRLVPCTASSVESAISEIETSASFKYFFDSVNNVLYYSSPQELSSEHPLCTPIQDVSILSNTNRNISLNLCGIETWYQSFKFENTCNADISYCVAKYISNYGGFYVPSSGSNIIFRNCEAARVCRGGSGDGFNGQGDASDNFGANVALRLIDCWAHDNNDDGYSSHQYSESVIQGGLFEYNQKAGVTPSYGEHCICYNVLSRHNINGFYYIGAARDNGKYGQMFAFNCIADNNTSCGFRVKDNKNYIRLYNCISMNNQYGYYSGDSNNIIDAIDCKTYNNTTIRSGNGVINITNCQNLA